MTVEHAAEYRASRERIGTLLTEADATVIVPACPAWTVADLCAHLAGVSSDLVNRIRPGSDAQAWVDGHVSSRKGRSIEALLDEWNGIAPAYEQLIVDKSHAFAFCCSTSSPTSTISAMPSGAPARGTTPASCSRWGSSSSC